MGDRKATLILLMIMVSLLVSIPKINVTKAEANQIIVPDDYPTITAAIGNASEGDNIFVKSGTYYESLFINKSLSLIGENRDTTKIDGGQLEPVIVIRHNNVNVTGFTLQNSESVTYPSVYPEAHAGIHLLHVNYCKITGNNIINNGYGIWLYNSSDNIISDNKIENNESGIRITESNHNTIIGNNVVNNTLSGHPALGKVGVVIDRSFNNTLKSNIIRENGGNFGVYGSDNLQHYLNQIDDTNTVDGKPIVYWINRTNEVVLINAGYIALVNCTGITVQNQNISGNSRGITLAFTNNSRIIQNTITNNHLGINLVHSSENSIENNTVTENSNDGISLNYHSNNNRVVRNIILNNQYAIGLHSHNDNNIIAGNDIIQNNTPFRTSGSHNNSVYHNNFKNSRVRTSSGDSTTIWDNGYPSGGNYWTDYVGVDFYKGAYQNETGSDGIGDTAHDVYVDIDNYPLIAPITVFDASLWEWTQYYVDVISNSSVSDFSFFPEGALIRFNVEGENGTAGFCRVTIPKDLLYTEGNWIALINGAPITPTVNEDENNTYLYFTYGHSTKTIEIIGTTAIPEFPPWTILPLLLMATLAAIIYKRRLVKKPN